MMKRSVPNQGGLHRLFAFVFAMAAMVSMAGTDDLAWPSDFDTKVAARAAMSEANATVYTAETTAYDTIGAHSAWLDGLGGALNPFDSRLMTWELASIATFSTKRPAGLAIVFR